MFRALWLLGATAIAISLIGSPASARPNDFYCSGSQALGVSRTVVVDTEGGPRFGRQFQDEGTSFLAPGEIVLTFDDGPVASSTGSILRTLDRFCAKATFFVVGRMAIVQPETLKDTARRGHTIAGHTWSHAKLARLGEAARIAEVEKGFSALSEVLGGPVAPFFRFPYLNAPESELERLSERDVAVFGIDVDSTDSHGQNVSARRIVERTLDGLEQIGKGVILLHDLKENTATALPDLLSALKEKGYRLVHMVAKRSFEPNAAFTAEVAEAIEKRRKKLEGDAAGPVALASRESDVTGSIRPLRHLKKATTGASRLTTSSAKKQGRNGRGKRGKRSKAEAVKYVPFRRI